MKVFISCFSVKNTNLLTFVLLIHTPSLTLTPTLHENQQFTKISISTKVVSIMQSIHSKSVATNQKLLTKLALDRVKP